MLSRSYLKAIDNIKTKGFTHIKFEFEADLNRGDCDSECQYCENGWLECDECNGDGYVENEVSHNHITEVVREECVNCNGEARYECDECNGRGRSRDSEMDTSECESWIIDQLPEKVVNALNFYNFYDDGSVDSELTFTLPIENAHYALEVMEAFKALSSEIGNGLDVSNAGMHITVMPSSVYPCRSGLLNSLYMDNFRVQVEKLLPGLYFAASHCGTTRSLEYRRPQVRNDDKYSAIYTHGDTCLEYRIFDTCYDQPESLLEKIETIAQTIKYYSTEKVNVKYKQFGFNGERNFNDAYNLPETLDALNETLKFVKPSKSIKRLKEDRRFRVNKRALVTELKLRQEKTRAEYERYVIENNSDIERRIDRFIDEQRHAIEQQRYTDEAVYLDNTLLDNRAKVKARLSYLGGYRETVTLEEYTKNAYSNYEARYTLTPSFV